MVRKLIKHEFSAIGRSMFPMAVILLAMSVFTRIIQIFEVQSRTYNIILGSAIVMLVIAMIVSLVMSVVISIKRFYTNMFTGEGYLTITLPVTATEHILTKLLVAFVSVVATVFAIIIAGSISTLGEVLVEIFKAIDYLADAYFDFLGGHGVAYIFEVLIAATVVIASQFLLYYACISVGQMAHKNRVLAAFGAYFGYYVITQIFGTILVIFVSLQPQWLIDLMQSITDFAANHPYAFIHYFIWCITLFYGVLSVVFFFISRYIITNKLNLE